MLFYEFEDPRYLIGSKKQVDTDSNAFLQLKDVVESIRQLSQSLSSPILMSKQLISTKEIFESNGTLDRELVDNTEINTKILVDLFTFPLEPSQNVNLDQEFQAIEQHLKSLPHICNVRRNFNKNTLTWWIVADKLVPANEETKSEPIDCKITK